MTIAVDFQIPLGETAVAIYFTAICSLDQSTLS